MCIGRGVHLRSVRIYILGISVVYLHFHEIHLERSVLIHLIRYFGRQTTEKKKNATNDRTKNEIQFVLDERPMQEPLGYVETTYTVERERERDLASLECVR